MKTVNIIDYIIIIYIIRLMRINLKVWSTIGTFTILNKRMMAETDSNEPLNSALAIIIIVIIINRPNTVVIGHYNVAYM